jgi:hypothetical protein
VERLALEIALKKIGSRNGPDGCRKRVLRLVVEGYAAILKRSPGRLILRSSKKARKQFFPTDSQLSPRIGFASVRGA